MKIIVNGLSVEDILDLSQEDIAKMSRSDLARVTSRLASAANKRLKRAKGSDFEATVRERAWGPDFSVKGKNQGQLQAEFARAKHFLTAKTSSVRGAREVFNKALKSVGAFDKEDAAELYKIMHKLQEAYPQWEKNGAWGSDQLRNLIHDEAVRKDRGDILDKLMEVARTTYRQEAEKRAEEEERYDMLTGAIDVGENPFHKGS